MVTPGHALESDRNAVQTQLYGDGSSYNERTSRCIICIQNPNSNENNSYSEVPLALAEGAGVLVNRSIMSSAAVIGAGAGDGAADFPVPPPMDHRLERNPAAGAGAAGPGWAEVGFAAAGTGAAGPLFFALAALAASTTSDSGVRLFRRSDDAGNEASHSAGEPGTLRPGSTGRGGSAG